MWITAFVWQFDQKGFLTIKGEVDFDELFMEAAEAGADDVVDEEGVITVYTPREEFGTVEQALTEAGYEFEDSELRWFPQNEIEIATSKAVQNMRLMEQLEESDDVQSVSSNLNITDDVIAAFES